MSSNGKLEIVFFPYRASMWDSLESVYLAAKADPSCEPYVVPLPGFDLGADRSLGRMDYEGDKFPDYIPITNWEEYDVEQRKPDIIFTHYPYDNVTRNYTIHPNYYSERLRKHCKLLVHIPYYVSISGKDLTESYCMLPGVVYADIVIVESEAVREHCIKEFAKFDADNNLNGAYGKPETKFIALGSPKYDALANSQNKKFELPEEWRKLIEKPDGTYKKMVYYNTHLRGPLEHGELFFRKLQFVFDTFKQQDDFVIWWRPHPNTELNLRTVRPLYLKKYLAFVDKFKTEAFGIYDDTPDLHRAVAMCDAFYGDFSSVKAFFEEEGKPSLIQNYKKLDNKHFLTPTSFFVINDYAWFTVYLRKGVYRAHIPTGKVEYVGCFPGDENRYCSYSYMAMYDNTLYFAPSCADTIGVCKIDNDDIRNCELSTISITGYERYMPDIKQYLSVCYKFYRSFAIGDKICFIPLICTAIMCYDTKNCKVTFYDKWVQELKESTTSERKDWLISACVADNKVFSADCASNCILEYSPKENTHKVYHVGDVTGWYDMCFDGSDFWLVPCTADKVVRWNPKSGIIAEYTNFPNNYKACKNGIKSIYAANGSIWLLPGNWNYVLKLSLDNGMFVEVLRIHDDFNMTKYSTTFFFNDKIYAYKFCSDDIDIFDTTNDSISKYKFDISCLPSIIPNDINIPIEKFSSEPLYMINDLLASIDKSITSTEQDTIRSNTGEKIHSFIVSLA